MKSHTPLQNRKLSLLFRPIYFFLACVRIFLSLSSRLQGSFVLSIIISIFLQSFLQNHALPLSLPDYDRRSSYKNGCSRPTHTTIARLFPFSPSHPSYQNSLFKFCHYFHTKITTLGLAKFFNIYFNRKNDRPPAIYVISLFISAIKTP